LMVLHVGGAARNGALVHVQRLLGTVTPPTFHALLAVMCLAAGLAYPLLMALARLLMPALSRVSYRRLSLVGIVFQGVLVCALSGILGALLCAVATAVGLLPALMGVHRSTVMSFLLIPVLSFYT
ncbi:MAG: tripartite tricarboxylate transporter permease, partial [Candidatus Methanofastidiosa archaeon]|nr:tripartite tricarboxylate transporter permease [Candidatus Methanofastidiosa archaeon]